jgi:hypothetical protein
MLGGESLEESQEPLPHEPTPTLFGGAPRISANPAVSSVATDAGASRPPPPVCLLYDLLISTLFIAGGGGIGASHGQDVPMFDSTEALMEEYKVLINCLEHVSLCEGLVFVFDDCLRDKLPCRRTWWLKGPQKCIADLERMNAELKAELDQSHIKIAEMELRQDSLKSGYRQLSDKYNDLDSAMEAWQ